VKRHKRVKLASRPPQLAACPVVEHSGIEAHATDLVGDVPDLVAIQITESRG
jgi:hypothetical protein